MKNFVTLCLVFISLTAFSQHKETYLGFKFGHLEMDNYDGRNYGGLELDIEYESHFGIQYSMLSGKNYFHMPMGPAAGLLLGLVIVNSKPLNDSTINRVGLGIILGLITTIIPESFSYNVPIHDNFSIAPYISPMQLDFLKNEGDLEGEWYPGLGLGTRFHVYLNDRKFRLSPYAEYKIHYSDQVPKGYTFGLNFAARVSKPKP